MGDRGAVFSVEAMNAAVACKKVRNNGYTP
jgi:hypothetical protein